MTKNLKLSLLESVTHNCYSIIRFLQYFSKLLRTVENDSLGRVSAKNLEVADTYKFLAT